MRSLRQIVIEQSSQDIVYIDESGFEADTYRPYAWSTRGQNSDGERNGRRGTRTSLIAAKSAPPALRKPQRKDRASRGKKLLAPVLFSGSTNARWFNQWLQDHLIPELNPNSTLILDHAPFHRKNDVYKIAQEAGHSV
ncbi:putative transposase [Stanieria sp. NIES-3757]|nr:putative transposase [Stanieria sp. NIES-3757]